MQVERLNIRSGLGSKATPPNSGQQSRIVCNERKLDSASQNLFKLRFKRYS